MEFIWIYVFCMDGMALYGSNMKWISSLESWPMPSLISTVNSWTLCIKERQFKENNIYIYTNNIYNRNNYIYIIEITIYIKDIKEIWFGTPWDSHWQGWVRCWQEIKNSLQEPHDFAACLGEAEKDDGKNQLSLPAIKLNKFLFTRGMIESESRVQDLACIEVRLHVGHGSLRTESCGQNVHRENASMNIPDQPWHPYPLSPLSCFFEMTSWNDKNKQQTKTTPTYSQPPWNIVSIWKHRLLFQRVHCNVLAPQHFSAKPPAVEPHGLEIKELHKGETCQCDNADFILSLEAINPTPSGIFVAPLSSRCQVLSMISYQSCINDACCMHCVWFHRI